MNFIWDKEDENNDHIIGKKTAQSFDNVEQGNNVSQFRYTFLMLN